MRRSLVVLALVVPTLVAAPHAEAVTTCGGKRATMVFGDGDDVVSGTRGDDVVVLGGRNDSYTDLRGDDLVCGGPGDDVITAGLDRDRVWGEQGDDWMTDLDGAGRARDTFSGGSGFDVLELGGTGVHLEVGDGRETGHEGDAFSGIDQYIGTRGDDVFIGTSGPDSYLDPSGHDVIRTGGGDDDVWLRRGR